MLFAVEASDTVIALLITAIGAPIMMQLFALYREYRNRKWDLVDKARLEEKRDKQAQAQLAELQSNTLMTEKSAEATLAVGVAVGATQEAVEEVKHATNSLTDRLVDAKGQAEFRRGGVEERARADAVTEAKEIVEHDKADKAAKTDKPMTLIKSIEAIPEKTAEKVVEKLEDAKQEKGGEP